MNVNLLKHIENVIPKVMNKIRWQETDNSVDNWYQKRKYFLIQNESFLKEVSKELKKTYHENYSKEDLFAMQKLYLCYPQRIPKRLLSLPWEQIVLLIELCNSEKRDFYVELSIHFQWDNETLEYYLLHDLYDKYIYILKEIDDYDEISSHDFLSHFLEVESLIIEDN